MHIEEKKITVREITENYFNDAEEGVVGYDEQLDIRPKYQREFVYKDDQRNEVIRTVMKGLPLNVMYWVDRGEEFEDDPDTPRYEVMDGQQRTISLCEYVDGNFSVDDMLFVNLPKDKQDEILDYELFIFAMARSQKNLTGFVLSISPANNSPTKSLEMLYMPEAGHRMQNDIFQNQVVRRTGLQAII